MHRFAPYSHMIPGIRTLRFLCVFALCALGQIGGTALPSFAQDPASDDSSSSEYLLDVSGFSCDVSGNLTGSIVVKNPDGSPAKGVNVLVLAVTAGGKSATPLVDTIPLGQTLGSGEIDIRRASVTPLSRRVALKVQAGATTKDAGVFTVGTIPEGFLTGPSWNTLDWKRANAYCAAHGGKLPPLQESGAENNGLQLWRDPWPLFLPSDDYWIGNSADDARGVAGIVDSEGAGDLIYAEQSMDIFRVVCVP